MEDMIPVSEAAAKLGVSPGRVRTMARSGQLEAKKIANFWLVDRASLSSRRSEKAPSGRPYAPRHAWAILLLASGHDAPGLPAYASSRVRAALKSRRLDVLAPRLSGRAQKLHFNAHPGEIPHVIGDEAFLPTGISASSELATDGEADGYIRASALTAFIDRQGVIESAPGSNLTLRVVPEDAWPLLQGRACAPKAAIALDLIETLEPRAESIGKRMLREFSRT